MNSVQLTCLIDDDPIYIFALKKLFKNLNFSEGFIVYNNGEDAINGLIEITNNGKPFPNLILLDINMPIMDGWQFLDDYINTSLNKNTPIYITSSSIKESDLKKAKKNTLVRHYINKPLTKETVSFIKKDLEQV
ncbi:two-component system response regulator [Lacinutrix sp. 5H-3-7-4]|uniref:response regulator n=1 Tax=Lacinutrix sp. (strain 5H-3-7-4) TaxID=983544 RepID=UPI00020A3A15|nr:response regulator [Lacinutrix sp. 5H-3-7-4]AEH00099.1 response regulator receiver [Lacinutrix sp. 5H-3-7-4]